jgi:hypothetical protein
VPRAVLLTAPQPGPVAPGGMGTLTYTVRVVKEMPEGTTAVKNVATAKVPDDSTQRLEWQPDGSVLIHLAPRIWVRV